MGRGTSRSAICKPLPWHRRSPSSCMARDSVICPRPSAGSRASISWTPSAAVSRPFGWRRADRLRRTWCQRVESGTGISIGQRLPVPQAAFMNGLLARSLEFDDMALPDLPPSGAIVPVVLALGEWQGASGGQVIVAYAIGLELCLRLDRAGYDRASRSSRFLERGQDATAICGTLARAAAAAELLGPDAKVIATAIGIAVSFAAGSLEANRSGGTIKRFQSGWAAKSAIQAALLAKYRVDGPAQALEGRYGFYHCFVDGQFDPLTLTDGLASDWQ